jgi:hypothetical protein
VVDVQHSWLAWPLTGAVAREAFVEELNASTEGGQEKEQASDVPGF